jgi:16S rRNA U516 pseudouridylate synthase RsuA-like enzyme
MAEEPDVPPTRERLTIELEPGQRRDLKLLAAAEGLTMRQLAREAIARLLTERKKERRRKL